MIKFLQIIDLFEHCICFLLSKLRLFQNFDGSLIASSFMDTVSYFEMIGLSDEFANLIVLFEFSILKFNEIVAPNSKARSFLLCKHFF